jgi:hypothetical protein
VSINPYLISAYIGWDNEWLRLRGAYEYHRDYFGLGSLGGGLGESLQSSHSEDAGILGLGMVKINAKSDYMTRIVVTGDLLKYHTNDETPNGIGQVNDLSRAAVYGLIQQHYKQFSLWVAGGHATEGTCGLKGTDATTGQPRECVTKGMSADYGTVGLLYSFTKDSGMYLIGYGLWNDVAARYSPFPLLDSQHSSAPFLPNVGEISYGSDTMSIGFGFVHVFNVGIFGHTPPPAAKPTEPAAAQADKVAPAEEQKKEADKAPADADVTEPEETEEKAPEAPKP